MQRVPAGQAGPAPQWHAPALQLLPLTPQLWHCAPLEPQLPVSTMEMQPASALQQPLHVEGSQTHPPGVSQISPLLQAAPPLQVQPPVTEHAAAVAPQLTQALPA